MEARLTGKPDDAQSVQSGLGRGGSKRAFGLRAGRLLHQLTIAKFLPKIVITELL